ncbi:MAG: hypothetical protein RIR66_503 [Actinomycetota bacterium]
MVYLIAGILPPPIRKLFFKMMFANFGKNILLSDKLYVRYPWKVWIGDNVAIGRNAQIFPSYLVQEASVHIANGVVIAPNLVILGAGHLPEDPHNSNIAASVTIDENVYIGANVVIRYGVTIGKNSVLAAGSVVVSNVPPNSIYGGNPAKLIRRIDK